MPLLLLTNIIVFLGCFITSKNKTFLLNFELNQSTTLGFASQTKTVTRAVSFLWGKTRKVVVVNRHHVWGNVNLQSVQPAITAVVMYHWVT